MQKLTKSLVFGSILALCLVASGAAISASAQTVPLSVSCYATPQTAPVGGSVTYVATATGGYGNYTYSWSGSNNLSGSGSSVSSVYSSAGQQSAAVAVTSNGQTQTATCYANVGQTNNTSNLYATCSANPYNANPGQQVTWSAYPSGGNGNYFYIWTGSDSLSGGNNQSITTTYSQGGQKMAALTVISGNQQYQTTCSTNINYNGGYYIPQYYNQLSAYCYGLPGKANIGDVINWYGSASGGQGGQYYYTWTGDDGFSGSGQELAYNYSTNGTKNAHMTVINNGQSLNVNCSVVIGPVYPVTYNNNVGSNGSNLASGVFLSQVPYTGAALNLKISLFLFGLFLWSAFAAYLMIKMKNARA